MLEQLLRAAMQTLVQNGVLRSPADPAIEIVPTPDGHRGDFTSNLALRLAGASTLSTHELACQLVEALPRHSEVAHIDIAGPGFINFSLEKETLFSVVPSILSSGDAYGMIDAGSARHPRIRLVFGLGLPSGRLPLSAAPIFATGASVERLLTSTGTEVVCEYYIDNDRIDSNSLSKCLEDVNEFDIKIDNTILGAREDALSAASNNFAPDSAFLIDTLENTPDRLLCILSREQQLIMERLESECSESRSSVNRLEFLLVPPAGWEGSAEVSSTAELHAALGRDAVRYFCQSRQDQAKIELDLTTTGSRAGLRSLYSVQYAHARICSVLRQARDKGFEYDSRDSPAELALLVESQDSRLAAYLVAYLASFPTTVSIAAETRDPHRVKSYLQELANRLNKYDEAQKWLTENHSLRNARFSLLLATRQVLANGLELIGVGAPEVL
ncbi:MAG: hypothetical protein KTR33_09730 [Gammaproteobacteria bacterium]|nr:hypothetical protein [Gammaproteobacteria bacterium]